MPFFGRRSGRTATPSPPVVGDLPCAERECAATTGVACAYVDRRGRACGTAWCPEHRGSEGPVLCRRHAGVMRALEASNNPTPPDIESRAASLAAWVAAGIDVRVVALLAGVSRPDEQLRVQPARLVLMEKRARAWQHAWKMARHTGFGHWVAVQVPEQEDDVVEVIVDGTHLHRSMPPWISARRQGLATGTDEDVRSRERYYDELIRVIDEHLATAAPR